MVLKNTMLRVAAFTGGRYAPPARFRVEQYIPLLHGYGVDVVDFSAPLGSWPPQLKWIRPFWFAGSLLSRIPGIVASHIYDVTLLQRSFISTYVTFEKYVARPIVLDVDDAIWVHPRGNFAGRLAEMSDSVICGNTYLAEYFSRYNKNIGIIPTGVDVDRFFPVSDAFNKRNIIVGWSGSSSNFRELYAIEESLAQVVSFSNNVILLITSDQSPRFSLIPPSKVKFVKWSPENEVRVIQDMDIGIMPLEDNVSTRGKCSYKMLLYMACGIPVVVSPVGMNKDVLTLGNVGFAASSLHEWRENLVRLLHDSGLRLQMGKQGRRIVEEHFSTEITAKSLAEHLYSVK